MSVIINAVQPKSIAAKKGVHAGDTLVSIDGNEITDVLDYRFYQNNSRITLEYINASGKIKKVKIKKDEYEELGLEFETYLMDKKHSCRNKCIFCFIDQLPKGLRDSLYYKDDDSRLSFLFGNYITLTNITEHEIERIIKMHISPVNISVHTTNPELRVKMMKNKNAGAALSIINRFNDAGIKLNCQLVLVPGINDGEELKRTLGDLTALENVESIAAVPVGLTRYRDNLEHISPFDKQNAIKTIETTEKFGNECIKKYGVRKVFASDEFYLLADALDAYDHKLYKKRRISIATGEAAYPFINRIVDNIMKKWDNLECRVYPVKNNFFGGLVDVAGLVTATDIYDRLKSEDLGEELLIPAVMLDADGKMFLDSVTLDELSERLNIKITPVENDGYRLTEKILGQEM